MFIDLIPRENAQAWLRYLRLPFHSSPRRTSAQTSPPPHPRTFVSRKRTSPLRKASPSARAASVNSLKRSKVCAVAARLGHTKEAQTVQLEGGLKIIDSPGVVFDEDDFDCGKGSSSWKT